MDINTCMHMYKYIYRHSRGHLYTYTVCKVYTHICTNRKGILYCIHFTNKYKHAYKISGQNLIFDQVRFPWNKGNSRNLSYLSGSQVVWGCNTYDYTDIPPTSMAMENWNHEWVDVSPIGNGDVPAGHVSFQGSIWDKDLHLTIQKVPFRLQLPIAHLEKMMLKDLEILNL